MTRLSLAASLALAVFLSGCTCDSATPGVRGRRDLGAELDGGHELDEGTVAPTDAHVRQDIGPDYDAFFVLDPPPRECLPDGGSGPPAVPPGGTPDCPDDKNRAGCPCYPPGTTAPCWPGLRANRDRGVCHDGTTTCEPFDEFSGRWGACTGYTLPAAGATRGAAACHCFSAGQWAIANLSPCFIDYGAGMTYAVSTYQDASGAPQCPSVSGAPPPSPMGPTWSTDTLNVDCQGHFRLCYTLKAGNATTPSPADCTVAQTCVEDWYDTPGATQTFPPLPSWVGASSSCAGQFATSGGYGEMSVQGLSIECDLIDDGSGAPFVFNRVNYCPLSCNTDPTAPGCAMCMSGGSGSF